MRNIGKRLKLHHPNDIRSDWLVQLEASHKSCIKIIFSINSDVIGNPEKKEKEAYNEKNSQKFWNRVRMQ